MALLGYHCANCGAVTTHTFTIEQSFRNNGGECTTLVFHCVPLCVVCKPRNFELKEEIDHNGKHGT